MFADVGNVPAVVTKGGEDYRRDDGWGQQFMWVFALVIIFLALVFLWGRRGEGEHRNNIGEALAPIAAASMLDHNKHQDGYNHGRHNDLYIWDVERDNMREFANVRQEITEKAWAQNRDSDRYFFETNRNIDNTRFEGERNTRAVIEANNQNTTKILERMHYDSEMRLRDQIMDERIGRGNERVINAVYQKVGHGGQHLNYYSQDVNPGYGYGYGC